MSILHRFLPHRCPLCLTPANDYLCPGCSRDLPQTPWACDQCGLPLAYAGQVCGDCLTHPKPFRLTVCAYVYAHPLDLLIHSFKTRQPETLLPVLAPTLVNKVRIRYRHQSWPDLLVPVPMHWRSRLSRGFNQAHALSDYLGRQLGLPVRPVVRQVRAKNPQKTLSRQARLQNLEQLFACTEDLKGQKVVLVDDVITTCATAIKLSECLLASGAKQVDVWALARTP